MTVAVGSEQIMVELYYCVTMVTYYTQIPVLEDHGTRTHWFEPGSIQTNNFKIDPCHFLARRSTLLGYGKDWFGHCQDDVTRGNQYQVMVPMARFSSGAAL